MSHATETPPASNGGPSLDATGPLPKPTTPLVCAVCGGEGMNRLCKPHLDEWLTSPERVRWAYWLRCSAGDRNKVFAAFADFVRTRQAEKLNGGNGGAA